MLASLIVVFREMLEAGLIIGIVLAATRGVVGRNRYVAGGIAGGIFGAAIVALFADRISNLFEGVGQELFNASVLGLAVVMLVWHIVWMARHGREMAAHMKEVGAEVVAGKRSLMALATVIAVAVLREGAETVLFMFGILTSGNESAESMFVGGAIGLALGMAVSALTYVGLLKIPARHLFKTTSALIALLAAGMAAQAASFLQQAQVVDGFEHVVWDSSHLISSQSLTGKILHTLIGYTDQPNTLQVMAYAATLLVIMVLMRRFGGVSKKA